MRLRAGGSALAGGLAAGAAYAVGSAQHSSCRWCAAALAWWHGSRTAVRRSAVRELCVCSRVLSRHARACALALCAERWELRLVRASPG